MPSIPVDDIVWDPAVYPRAKWSTATIERYADALDAGEQFPPLVLEAGTNRLLDGKHRLEAHRRASRATVDVELHDVPDGMTAKHYAATLSARHGDRMTNADLRALAVEDFEADPKAVTPAEWGRHFGVSERQVRRWVSHIVDRERRRRQTASWRLTQLGWTQRDIGQRFGVTKTLVQQDLASFGHLSEICQRAPEGWNDRWVADEAARLDVGLTEAMAAALTGADDIERFERLDIKLQPYDVWSFAGCHDLMGDAHPGRIPGQLVCHALHLLTKPGDLVIDPMAGSGTTLDACLLMGRHARGYDIDGRHERADIEAHDLSDGWPKPVAKASLIFWDPPYFDKMDSGSVGADGYIAGSISGFSADRYLGWLAKRFGELHAAVKPGTWLAFVMSDWDPEGAKRSDAGAGIFQWDYADLLRDTGWVLRRQVQCPLSTQQVHPDIVGKFRASGRLARLARYMLVAEA